ncbi:MAG: hypothetical protein IPN86_24075 [Saprospiraceae bacterium]|nr:hypothetical protein [Saprospiraceae bacterium]
MKNIVSFISSYDMGVYILEPTNFNNGMALPNKIFEYIQARLAAAIGPSSEMKGLTENYNIGVVSHDFKSKSLANILNNLRKEDISNFKNNSNSAAKILNSESNIKIIKDSVFNMIGT